MKRLAINWSYLPRQVDDCSAQYCSSCNKPSINSQTRVGRHTPSRRDAIDQSAVGRSEHRRLVALHPVDPNAPRTPEQPAGGIQADGRFEIMSYDVGDGVPAGEYAVTIREAPRADSAPKPTLPAKKFRDPKTTPLRITVEAKGLNELPPLVIAE